MKGISKAKAWNDATQQQRDALDTTTGTKILSQQTAAAATTASTITSANKDHHPNGAEAASTGGWLFPRKSWGRFVAKTLIVTLPFWGPSAADTNTGGDTMNNNNNIIIINNNNNNNNTVAITNTNIDVYHDSYHRHNRQLLENGLRGGINHDKLPELDTDPSSSTTFENSRGIPVSNTSVPLHFHSGTHHVHLYVGSPPQRQTLIVDTGSRAMAFPCKTDDHKESECCGTHASPYFDPSRSTTHLVSKCGSCLLEGISSCPLVLPTLGGRGGSGESGYCTFSQKYTEGSSWTATEVEDLVWLGSSSELESLEDYMELLAVPYPFGCQTYSTGLFRKQYADGILGLSLHETSLVTAFYNDGLISANAFSLCVTPKGGVLSLGGSLDPSRYHRAPMRTTPIVDQHRERGYYSVSVVRLRVGGITVTDAATKPGLLERMNSGKGCILDSGTTDSYFPAGLAKAFRRAASEHAQQNGISISISNSNSNQNNNNGLDNVFSERLRRKHYTYQEFEGLLPEITVVFTNGVELTIPPKHYMESVPLDDSGKIVPWEGSLELTNRLYFEEADGSVLGANAMFGYDIFFDGGDEHAARVGIAPSDCHTAAIHTEIAGSTGTIG